MPDAVLRILRHFPVIISFNLKVNLGGKTINAYILQTKKLRLRKVAHRSSLEQFTVGHVLSCCKLSSEDQNTAWNWQTPTLRSLWYI